MAVAPPGGPGLSVAWFLDSLPDQELRRFLDSGVLSVLDALFGGRIDGEDLRRMARTLVDFDVLLGDPDGRKLVLSLVPDQKRTELEGPRRADHRCQSRERVDRIGGYVGCATFFGLVEERILPPAVPPTDTITPTYGLFDHQRNGRLQVGAVAGRG